MAKLKALSLLEILISLIILSLVMLGFANVFTAGKRILASNRSHMAGSEIGKAFVDDLQQQVRQDQWTTSDLGKTGAGTFSSSRTIDGVKFNAVYSKDAAAPPSPGVKKVQVQISWPRKN